uniref:Protein kinase domain-containing protein n=1 Tax=Rhabditophanes sp. KR3021 TaxID=114890 RepID=A0AC35UDS0_9BILA
MASGKKRNLLGLSLPPTVTEDAENPMQYQPLELTLEETLRKMVLSEPQMARMLEWMQTKLRIGTLTADSIEVIQQLGQGNGGVVSKWRHIPTNVIMAAKVVHVEVRPTQKAQIMKELEILHKCTSPYIVGFYGAFTDNNDISICMEYMDGLSLDIVLQKTGKIAEKFVGRISASVVKGLSYLKEEHKILHRDVKPSNILVNSRGEIKLCDFGVSAMLINSMANSFVGTRSYMAPERLQGSEYSIHSDVWSFGMSLVEISVGRFPIPAVSRQEFVKIFGVPEEQVILPDGLQWPRHVESNAKGPTELAIFELLEYISTEDPPFLPLGIYSPELVQYTSKCLKKNQLERPNLKALRNEPFYLAYQGIIDTSDVAEWVQGILRAYERH